MQRPSLLTTEEPLDALCHHLNVSPATLSSASFPETFDMPVIRDAHMPTHVLAVVQPDADPSLPPFMLPINVTLYDQGFRVELTLPSTPPGTASPIPHYVHGRSGQVVTLPVVPISVPHAASMPLLLLFGLDLEKQPNLMAWRLLPPQVIEEFPNAAAMAQVLAGLPDAPFQRCVRYNQGLWRNILALGLRNTRIVELVQTAWNVTVEARRIRQRAAAQRQ